MKPATDPLNMICVIIKAASIESQWHALCLYFADKETMPWPVVLWVTLQSNPGLLFERYVDAFSSEINIINE